MLGNKPEGISVDIRNAVFNPNIKLHILPGGLMPVRKTDGAIGYDVALRAIVSATEMDMVQPHLRKTLFDFKTVPEDQEIAQHGKNLKSEVDQGGPLDYVYMMDPGESVLAGIGFLSEMPFPLMYWVAPRSGLAAKHGITVTNAPGTVDPDYRGEAAVLVYNRNTKPYPLRKNMRIAQIVFMWAVVPLIEVVDSLEDLDDTARGAGGFGSTGIHG